MLITRTPFRISLCGGGSDIPSFYNKHGGCVISTSINKYVYFSIHPLFDQEQIVVKYSKTENVYKIADIEHRYFNSILQSMDIKGVEITCTADIPAGTGLGSSSAFAVGLLHVLSAYKSKYVSKEWLGARACYFEIEVMEEPIGKQDQYAVAYGGLNYYYFEKNGDVFAEPIMIGMEAKEKLDKNLMLFYTGKVRSASSILKEQSINITYGEKEENQLKMCELTQVLRKKLQMNDIDAAGDILHQSWMLKKGLASGITNPSIDDYYELALKNGALGGKLLGAGGGGFLLFYVPEENRKKVRDALPLKEMKFSFDGQGSTIIYVGNEPNILN